MLIHMSAQYRCVNDSTTSRPLYVYVRIARIVMTISAHTSSPGNKELLTYMNDTQAYPVEESKNDLIRKLDAAVNETKMKPVWRDAFMMYQMRLRDEAIKNREGGRKEEKRETAKRMLLKAMPTDLIAELSGLPLAEVNALKTQMVH